MKRTLSVLLLAGTALAAMSAYAAPVFLLQFGSFESRAEADEKLAALKTKHAGVLSRMEIGVREVTLKPDNLIVYRTQAGPLATRSDAQSVCSQLASNGDECYVVETAMMQPATPPTQQVAQAVPAPVSDAKPEVSAAMPATPMPEPAPAASMAARDPQNIAAMNRVATAPMVTQGSSAAAAPAPVMEPTKDTSPETAAMHRELAEAAGEAPAAETPKASPKPPVKDRSLWERMFGSDGDDRPVSKPIATVKADDAVQAVPVEPIAVTAPEPAPMPVAEPAPEPVVMAAAPTTKQSPGARVPDAKPEARTLIPATPTVTPVPSAPLPVMAPPAPMAVQPQPVAPAPIAVEAQPFPLPPPPAPLTGMSRPVINQPLALPLAATVPAPMPVEQQPIPPTPLMPQPQATGAVPLQPVPAANVRVEEAKRVPLTQATTPPPMPVAAFPPPSPSATPVPALTQALSPSASIGQKTLWAQIGSFRDQQTALAYWEQYRRTHPDFPVVRVRVTSPYMAQQRGVALVNLRVGPFARQGSISNLCATIEDEAMYQCGTITDMGAAASVNGQRGLLPQSRYRR